MFGQLVSLILICSFLKFEGGLAFFRSFLLQFISGVLVHKHCNVLFKVLTYRR